TITLATQRGDIKVILPSDIAAGDTISGTVSAEPKGKDEKERKQNYDRLIGYFVNLGGESSRGSSGEIHAKITDGSSKAELTATDEQKKQLAQAFIALLRLAELNTAGNPVFPPLGQSGRPYAIGGAFDGNSTNTNVKIGGADAKVIAES